MNNEETPTEYKDKFQLIFVEQGWTDPSMINPKDKDWVAGRVDIRTWDDQHGPLLFFHKQISLFSDLFSSLRIHEIF